MRKYFVFNNDQLKEVRVDLRRTQTLAEKIMWSYLRRENLGHKFYRQYSVGVFVVDFCCPKRKLAIEIDGDQHSEINRKIYDKNRSEYLKLHGLKVIRFRNNEVTGKIDWVIEMIKSEL